MLHKIKNNIKFLFLYISCLDEILPNFTASCGKSRLIYTGTSSRLPSEKKLILTKYSHHQKRDYGPLKLRYLGVISFFQGQTGSIHHPLLCL